MITLYTLSDSVIESDEIIEIRVEINTKKPVYCSTTVRIVDDSKWLMYNFLILMIIIILNQMHLYMLVDISAVWHCQYHNSIDTKFGIAKESLVVASIGYI